MDDLKVVLYIVIAIIWVVYNNYKKINEASRKRDLSKPPEEVIHENWPSKKTEPIRPVARKIQQTPDKQTERQARKVLERRPLPQRQPLKQKVQSRPESIFIPANLVAEGGTIAPSKVVQFQDQPDEQEAQHPIIQAIKSMDIRSGIVLSELLKWPYN